MVQPHAAAAPDFSAADRRCGRSLRLRLALAALCLSVGACGGDGGSSSGSGGGGSSSGSGSGSGALGIVRVTVSDSYGTPIAGASVQGPQNTTTTDALGVTLVAMDGPGSTATLAVSRSSFVSKSVPATSSPSQVNEVVVTLDRATAPAGASLGSRSGNLPTIGVGGQELSFEIELIVVDGNAQPLESLGPANFSLHACTPDAANGRVDCLRGSAVDADLAYTPATSAPASVLQIAGGAVMPFAAALLLDQSGSILQNDPTGARLYSAKAFLGGLGQDDQALLAAFAGAPGATLPSVPLSVYGPFRNQSTAPSYFATLDSLQPLVGGSTPLYASLDALRQQVVADGSLPVGSAKSVVLFTDGADNSCGDAQACRTRREQSIQGANADQVRLFTIGLSSGVDALALGELANQTGGAFLYADTAEQLLPLYGSLGRLLSLSLPAYRLRFTVQAGAPNVFRSGDTLLGRVQVTQGPNRFDIPFLVGIP